MTIKPSTSKSESDKSLQELVASLRLAETTINQGGGTAAIDRQHAKSRLTARERIAKLIV